MRDPAMAALMGVLPLTAGANFGASSTFGNDSVYGDPFGDDVGEDGMGADFGDDMSAEFGAARRRPNPQALATLWKRHAAQAARKQKRELILEPNKGSDIKVERYSFTVSQAITLGTALATFTTLSGQPDTTIRPQRVTTNAPTPMFVFIQEIKVANVSVTVGSGVEDAFNYNALGVGQSLDMPTLSPANRASVLGNYTGFVPPGFAAATATFFSVSFKGPASIVA